MTRLSWLAPLTLAFLFPLAQGQDLPDPLAAGWQGEPVCECLHRDERLRVLRCSFPPGVGHERHYHPPHVGYVIAGGRMEITSAEGTRQQDVATGVAFSNPDGIPWHQAVNIGTTTASYLMIEPATENGPPLDCE